MDVALFLVLLAVGVLAGAVVARWIGIPAPLLLVVAGVAASFLPFVPQVHLEPEVVLLGLLPPLLYSAALTSSLVDFNAHRRVILLLSVGAVLFTTAGVGWVVHETVPGISWPIALALGAVVAPPDAVAVSSKGSPTPASELPSAASSARKPPLPASPASWVLAVDRGRAPCAG